MKLQAAVIALLSLMTMPSARTEETAAMTGSKPALTYEDVRKVARALEAYTQKRLLGEVWKRPGLAPRDRSIVTLAALIARNQTIEMPYHFNLALDNGVKPREISEIITHLAFYAGWANAMSAVAPRHRTTREPLPLLARLPGVEPGPGAGSGVAARHVGSGMGTINMASIHRKPFSNARLDKGSQRCMEGAKLLEEQHARDVRSTP